MTARLNATDIATTHGIPTVVELGGRRIGGGSFGVAAGVPVGTPVELALEAGVALTAMGATLIHDGTASQTDPLAPLDLGRLELLAKLHEHTGLQVAAALHSAAQLDAVLAVADVIQLAAYQMQNYTLLQRLGEIDRPVVLRRGSASTLDELLGAAEYILNAGNPNVLLCERGIRTFDPGSPALIDVASVPILKEMTHLPVLVDPSELRQWSLIESLALAAAAIGSDGVILEIPIECLDRAGDLVSKLADAAELSGNHLA